MVCLDLKSRRKRVGQLLNPALSRTQDTDGHTHGKAPPMGPPPTHVCLVRETRLLPPKAGRLASRSAKPTLDGSSLTKRRQFDAFGSWKRNRGQFTGPEVLTDRSGPRNHEFSMITSLFGPLGAPGPLELFSPDLSRLYQRHWGLEGSRKAKQWRQPTPNCSS